MLRNPQLALASQNPIASRYEVGSSCHMKIRWRMIVIFCAVGITGSLFYLRGNVRYCWFVFGPKGDIRVLARVTRQGIAIDANRNGKFQSGERFSSLAQSTNVVISDRGDRRYTITGVSEYLQEGERHLMVNVDVAREVNFQQYADVALRRSRSLASVAHFDGPLTVQAQTINGKLPDSLALYRGDKPSDIRVVVGTLDLKRGCWVVVRLHLSTNQPAFPANVFPQVDVEFPTASIGPVAEVYPLNKFC